MKSSFWWWLRLSAGPVLALLFLSPWLLGTTECNAYSSTANKTSDQALTFTAQTQIDAQDYVDALATIAQITPATLATHDGLVLQATVHAGLCGLNLVNMANDVSNQITNGGSTSIMTLMLSEMRAATSYSNCSSAEQFMLQVQQNATMTSDDEIFLAFIEFAKIGAVLESASSGLVDPTHSGSVASGVDVCLASTLTNTEVGEVGASLNIALEEIQASGLTIASSVTSALTGVCTPKGVLPCTIYTASGFSANQLLLLRTAINTQEVGLNTCPGSITSTSCLCLHN